MFTCSHYSVSRITNRLLLRSHTWKQNQSCILCVCVFRCGGCLRRVLIASLNEKSKVVSHAPFIHFDGNQLLLRLDKCSLFRLSPLQRRFLVSVDSRQSPLLFWQKDQVDGIKSFCLLNLGMYIHICACVFLYVLIQSLEADLYTPHQTSPHYLC